MEAITFRVKTEIKSRGKPTKFSVNNDLNGELTLEELVKLMRRTLITVSHDLLKKRQAQGFEKDPVTIVDNRLNKPILQVKPFGKIEFKKRVKSLEIIVFAYKEVLKRSPVESGNYRSSHFVFLNGTRIASTLSELLAWEKTNPKIERNDFIRIVNSAPYARRLERLGVTRQRTRRVRIKNKRTNSSGRVRSPTSLKPNGVYFLSTRAAKRKYKGNVSIYFGFIPGSLLGLTAMFKGGGTSKRKPRTYLYPTIKIYIGGKRGVSD